MTRRESYDELEVNGPLDTDDLSIKNEVVGAALDGYVVPFAAGVGLSDAIDPTQTTTPFQDALDLVENAGGGRILLPPTTITEEATIEKKTNQTVVVEGCGHQTSIIESTVSGSTSDVLFLNGYRLSLNNLQIKGSGINNQVRSGVRVSSGQNSGHHVWNNVTIRDLGGPAILNEGIAWDWTITRMEILNVDNGDGEGIIVWNDGRQVDINNVMIIAETDRTGSNSTAITTTSPGAQLNFGTINCGGSIGRAINHQGGNISVDILNYERERESGETVDCIVRHAAGRGCHVGQITVAGGESTNAYLVDGGLRFWFGYCVLPGGNLTGDTLNATSGGAGVFLDESANATSTASNNIACLRDLTIV